MRMDIGTRYIADASHSTTGLAFAAGGNIGYRTFGNGSMLLIKIVTF